MRRPGDIGGAMFVIGCHTIDRILLHFGMPQIGQRPHHQVPRRVGDRSREDAAGAILNYDDKIVTLDFMSWDPLPWTESWDITAYGTEGLMHSRPLPASYKIYRQRQERPSRRLDRLERDQLPRDLGGAQDGLLA